MAARLGRRQARPPGSAWSAARPAGELGRPGSLYAQATRYITEAEGAGKYHDDPCYFCEKSPRAYKPPIFVQCRRIARKAGIPVSRDGAGIPVSRKACQDSGIPVWWGHD